MPDISRRHFLVFLQAFAATSSSAALLRASSFSGTSAGSFPAPADSAVSGIRLGYAAITWGTDGRQAIEDISAVGFHGIQLRANQIKEFEPAQMGDLLRQHGLTFVALSSGDVHIDPAAETADLALHAANAKYVRDAGGLYLQVIDSPPKDRPILPADCERMGHLLTQIGKRTADLGIPLGIHNHMGRLSERLENLDRILEASDPRYVKLELDVGHYVQGGGDPVKAIDKYHDRLLFLHLKDVRDADPKAEGAQIPYQWVELGRGRVDLPGVVAALNRNKFNGWAVVELDRVPDNGGTPKNSAMINKKYLEEKLGLTI